MGHFYVRKHRLRCTDVHNVVRVGTRAERIARNAGIVNHVPASSVVFVSRSRREFRRARLRENKRAIGVVRRIRCAFATTNHFDIDVTRLGFVGIRGNERSTRDLVRPGIAGNVDRATKNARSAQFNRHVVLGARRRPSDRDVLSA